MSQKTAHSDHQPAAISHQRLPALDALRGLIMALMALDHASAFVARVHMFEFWGRPLPYYGAALPFLTRLASHLCAPGFFFLMGTSMILFADARRAAGRSQARIRRHFILRGLVLVLVEQILENPAWILGALGGSAGLGASGFDTVPGGGSPPRLMFGVLTALGGAMIAWAPLLQLPAAVSASLGVGAIVLTQWFVSSADADALYSPLVRLLCIPGHTSIWFVLYPIVPWAGVTGLGIAFGRMLSGNPASAALIALRGAAGMAAIFLALRLAGSGDLHQMAQPNWIGILNVTKYPPSVAFVLMTLAANGALLALFDRVAGSIGRWGQPLLAFGRTPLFFYIVHLYLFALIGFAFPDGTTLPRMYPVWLAGVAAMYALCRWYEGFKRRQHADSLWRLL